MSDSGRGADVRVDRSGRCATIVIDRPDRLNALATTTMSSLIDAVEAAARDDDVWVIVLTGAGDRAFCAGADLKEADAMARAGKSYPHPMTGPQRNVFEVVLECPKPTVAAINGHAMGAGFELVMACDVRLAVAGARLGLPEAQRGMGANFGSVMLPRLLPRALALDLLYSGRSITAESAQAMGLVNAVHSPDAFTAAVSDYAQLLASNAPLTLQRYKQMALRGWEIGVHAALRLNVGPNPYASEDRVEGVRAFTEKRPARFQGR